MCANRLIDPLPGTRARRSAGEFPNFYTQNFKNRYRQKLPNKNSPVQANTIIIICYDILQPEVLSSELDWPGETSRLSNWFFKFALVSTPKSVLSSLPSEGVGVN